MALTHDEVRKIAHLARLAIEPDDIPHHALELSAILGLVEQMSEVETGPVEPLAHPLDLEQRLRADEVTEPDQRESFQAIAPATGAGLYLVPKVIE